MPDASGHAARVRRRILGTFVVSVLGVGAAYASAFLPGGAPAWAAWVMAAGTAGSLVAAMALGAERDGRLGRLKAPFAFVLVVLVGGFWTVLALPPVEPGDPELWAGLPPRAAVVLYGIGLLPLLVVPVAYALTFDELTLSEEDWARVRRAAGTDGDESPGRAA